VFDAYHKTIVITEIDKMSNKRIKTRLYIDVGLKAGATHLLTGNQGHYLINVLRLKMAGYIAVFNDHDRECPK